MNGCRKAGVNTSPVESGRDPGLTLSPFNIKEPGDVPDSSG